MGRYLAFDHGEVRQRIFTGLVESVLPNCKPVLMSSTSPQKMYKMLAASLKVELESSQKPCIYPVKHLRTHNSSAKWMHY